MDTYREVTARTSSGDTVEIGAVRGADRRNLRFVGGGEREKMREFFSGGDTAIVTESFAHRHGTREGNVLKIRTPSGLAALRVAGVYYDYTSDRGLIMIDRGVFERWWHDPGVNSVAVYLKPGADAQAAAGRARSRWAGRGLIVYTNGALRQRILAVFDQTFAVTGVIKVIAVLVAIVGVFLALTALVIERAREIAVLRAIGASRGQVRGMLLSEAALLGTVASALGIAAGMCLAMVLTWVVNKAFFGWTIELQWPWPMIATTPLWIVAAAMLAALPPACRKPPVWKSRRPCGKNEEVEFVCRAAASPSPGRRNPRIPCPAGVRPSPAGITNSHGTTARIRHSRRNGGTLPALCAPRMAGNSATN